MNDHAQPPVLTADEIAHCEKLARQPDAPASRIELVYMARPQALIEVAIEHRRITGWVIDAPLTQDEAWRRIDMTNQAATELAAARSPKH